MGQVPLHDTPEFRALMATLEQEWPSRQIALRASGVPLNDGDDPPAGPPTDPPADPPADPPTDDPDDAGLDEKALRSALENARREAASNRIAARDGRAALERLQEIEDRDKTEVQRLEERAETAERNLAVAERSAIVAQVALDKGLTQAQSKRLVGTTTEELEADADELLASFKDDSGGQEPTGDRPRVRLRPGAAPSATEVEETDPAKLAAKVPRPYGPR